MFGFLLRIARFRKQVKTKIKYQDRPQDHLEDCGLEEAISLTMQPINGNLVHAVAERWNPRTNTFWFPWGEMTITLDEFSIIMGLLELKGDPRGPIEDQFLVNQGQLKTLEVIRKLTGKQSWPFLEKDGHQYLQLQELGETYSQFVNPASLSRSVADKYKSSMVTCTAGLIFFNNEEHIMDFRTACLFRKWGHVQVRHISIAMTALAFLYRGLTKFSIGDTDLREGCVFALQAWFYKHVGPQSCQFQNTDDQLSSMEHYRRKMEEVNIRFMVEIRSQQRRRIEMELEQPFMGDKGEEFFSKTPPKLEMNDPEFEEYRRFQRYMIMFNEEQAQIEKAKKKGKKTKKNSSSSSDSSEETTTDSSSEEEPKTHKKKKKGESWKIKIQEVEKKLNAIQLNDKYKKNLTCEDFYESFENDKHIKNLPKKFIKFDGHGDPKAQLAIASLCNGASIGERSNPSELKSNLNTLEKESV
ncbi:Serine/threonine-phosphatase 7 long form-like protein [Nymphaea thermarum]|nr:Serine/threonine-phosphatase 7 long form-like protein [Nymphaea thermarum]